MESYKLINKSGQKLIKETKDLIDHNLYNSLTRNPDKTLLTITGAQDWGNGSFNNFEVEVEKINSGNWIIRKFYWV